MLAAILAFLVATAVNAAPYARRGLAQVIDNCNHDLAYTFDDGPYIYHDEISNDFEAVGGKTTFFVNGDNWSCIYDQDNVAALRLSYEQGHQIAHHTWSHPDLTTLTHEQIDYEIQRLDQALINILGIRPKFFRPPYGSLNDDVASYIQNTYGRTIVTWSDDSGDSTGGTTQQSYDLYAGFAAQGPGHAHMALSHETEPAGIGAVREGTVTLLANAGIKLETVAQCLDSDPYEYIGPYGTPDDTWYCGGSWSPSSPGSSTTPPPSNGNCVQTYTSQAGDTCTSIETKFGLPSGSILQANSFLNCNDIWTNTPICIPPGGSTTPPPSCVSTYKSVAGDTCASIETKYGLPSGAILQANSFLTCNDIWTNTPICIPPGGSTTPPPSCVSTYTSVSGDTCTSIETKFGLPSGAILQANSFLTCNDIWVNTPICVPPGGSGGGSCTLTISSAPGDTCDSIGAAYGVSGSQIQTWNEFLDCQDIWTNTPVCVRH